MNEDKCYYLACPDCKKKVVEDSFGYRCENCQRNHSTVNASYILTAKISDFSGNLYVQFMQDAGDHVMNGNNAEQFRDFKENSDANEVKDFFQKCQFKVKIICLLYTSPSPRDLSTSRMPSSA